MGRRCEITGNECGTDTWMKGRPCKCDQCQAYLDELLTAVTKERDAAREKMKEVMMFVVARRNSTSSEQVKAEMGCLYKILTAAPKGNDLAELEAAPAAATEERDKAQSPEAVIKERDALLKAVRAVKILIENGHPHDLRQAILLVLKPWDITK